MGGKYVSHSLGEVAVVSEEEEEGQREREWKSLYECV